jgi:hypothetical protein
MYVDNLGEETTGASAYGLKGGSRHMDGELWAACSQPRRRFDGDSITALDVGD